MFVKIVRQVHMYLALFLVPWMLMYAVSGMVMNHRDFFAEYYGGHPLSWQKERELTYDGQFAPDATPEMMARRILSDLDMDGAHWARRSDNGERVTIFRNDPIAAKRITFTPADGKLVIERAEFRTPTFLTRLHGRRGYQQDYFLEDAWGFCVDLVIFAIVFWGISGLWLWTKVRPTRQWGLVSIAAGTGLFLFFLFTI